MQHSWTQKVAKKCTEIPDHVKVAMWNYRSKQVPHSAKNFRRFKMAKYVVQYETRKQNSSSRYSKTVECETEATAITIAKGQASKDKPGYDFILVKVEKK